MKEDKYITDNWFSTFALGHEDPGVKHWLDDTERSFGCNNGFTETDVTYIINPYRYRGVIHPDYNIPAAFGCSYTLGQGTNQPWPELIDVANCGMNGASNDRITRSAITYCKMFHPKIIFVMWTFPERREYVTEDGSISKFRRPNPRDIARIMTEPTEIGAHLILMNEHADMYNLQKNRTLLESYCNSNNIELRQLSVNTINKNNYKLARDDDHPGPDWHASVAAHFLF